MTLHNGKGKKGRCSKELDFFLEVGVGEGGGRRYFFIHQFEYYLQKQPDAFLEKVIIACA